MTQIQGEISWIIPLLSWSMPFCDAPSLAGGALGPEVSISIFLTYQSNSLWFKPPLP